MKGEAAGLNKGNPRAQTRVSVPRLIFVPGEVGLVAEAAVEFAGGEVADAELGKVGGIALVELLEWKVFCLDLIVAELEGFAVVNGGGDDGAAVGVNTDAEFEGGGFVIGDEKTVANTGAIHEVQIERAIAGRCVDAAGDASAEGQLMSDGFGVFFEAIEDAGVLVEEYEEESGAE